MNENSSEPDGYPPSHLWRKESPVYRFSERRASISSLRKRTVEKFRDPIMGDGVALSPIRITTQTTLFQEIPVDALLKIPLPQHEFDSLTINSVIPAFYPVKGAY